jgi:hypothetical protein
MNYIKIVYIQTVHNIVFDKYAAPNFNTVYFKKWIRIWMDALASLKQT